MESINTVNFENTFHTPHRITLSRPSASYKTLVDVEENAIHMSWSNHSLLDAPLNVWQQPNIEWKIDISLLIDGEKALFTNWHRMETGYPGFIIISENNKAKVKFEGIATVCGDVIKTEIASSDKNTHEISIIIEHKNGWVISNPSWADGENQNTLMCMQGDISDRLLAVSFGADNYPVPHSNNASNYAGVPMNDMEISDKFLPQKSIVMQYTLSKSNKKQGYIIHPYEKYANDIKALSQTDWENNIKSAKKEWYDILHKNAELIIPDDKMNEAFLACFADLFVMREQMPEGNYGVVCGTETYRSTNAGEPVMTDMFFDTMGYEKEVNEDIWLHINAYDESGNWHSPKGWASRMWLAAGLKALMVMEHYKLTNDIDFLEKVYPVMKNSSKWQHKMRSTTKSDKNSPFYGLMPRGMGDCGLMDDDDYFGVFYPHNCYSVMADRLTLEAAKILGKTQDFETLKEIYESAKNALISSLEKGAIEENGYRRIPGVANKRCGSQWGALYAYYCGFLEFNHPLINGTLKHIEQNISDGGLPLDLGWMNDGLWVAIALDNISAVYLKEGLGDEAVKYLYPTVNHASWFVTWCEERGKEKNTERCSGDRQHLWTPLAVCRYIRDALCCNVGDTLYLSLGTPREWLTVGNIIGVKRANVYGGKIDYTINRKSTDTVIINIHSEEFEQLGKIKACLRLPETYLNITTIDATNCDANFANNEIEITAKNANITITATLK